MSQRSPIDIRTFEPGDQTRLDAIIRTAFAAGEISGWEPYEIDAMIRGVGSTPGLTFLAIADGQIAGFLAVDYSMVIVSPEARRRGIGSELARAALAAHPQLELAPPVGSEIAEPFLRSINFAPHHLLWQLTRDQGATIDQPEAPDGFTFRTYRDDDFPAYHALLNRTFSDHPTPLSVSEERMRTVHEREDFDPTLILLVSPAERPEAPIAFTFVRVRPDSEGTLKGGIGMIGVDRDYRKRGFGRLLLRWGIWRLQQAGCATINLEVVDSNDRALPLYQSEGFVSVRAWPYWAPAASHHSGAGNEG